MLAALDILQRLDDEALTVVCVGPAGLSGALVVKHVGVRYKAICLDTLYLDAEDAAGDHHADLRVLFQGELAIVGHFVANRVVVLLNVADLLTDLVLEGAAF